MKGVAFDVCGGDAATEVSTADEQRELLLGEGRKASAHINHKVFAAVSTGAPIGLTASRKRRPRRSFLIMSVVVCRVSYHAPLGVGRSPKMGSKRSSREAF